MAKKIFISKEDFQDRMESLHSGNYVIPLPEHDLTRSLKLEGTCLKHDATFTLSVDRLMEGRHPCRFCSMRGLKPEDLEKLAKEKWGDRWDFSETRFTRLQDFATIRCPKHGVFEQRTKYLLMGRNGCKVCINQVPMTREKFIKRAQEKYGNQVDYSLVGEVKNARSIVTLKCVEHQRTYNVELWWHLRGIKGCNLCSSPGKPLTKERFIFKSQEIWGKGSFDYSSVSEKLNSKDPVTLFCLKHELEFQQTPDGHYQGKNGCHKCESKLRLTSFDEFLTRSKSMWGEDKYDYSRAELKHGVQGDVTLRCIKHDQVFTYSIFRHLRGLEGCHDCRTTFGPSKAESELANWVESLGIDVVRNDRSVLGGKEIDIWIPSLNVGIEFNGLYWHSEAKVGKHHHFNKSLKAREEGVTLVHVWEDDWKFKRELVEDHLLKCLGMSSTVAEPDSLFLAWISVDVARNFWSSNSLEMFPRDFKKALGIFENDALSGVVMVDCTSMGTAVRLRSTHAHDVVSVLPRVVDLVKDLGSFGDFFFEADFALNALEPNPVDGLAFAGFTGVAARDRKNFGNVLEEQVSPMNRFWDCGNMRWKIS